MNQRIIASIAGWNASQRACRESSLKFYYSYVGYKLDVGEAEVARYVVEHREEFLDHVQGFIDKPNGHSKPRRPPKPAKRKPKLADQRRAAILSSELDRSMWQAIHRDK